MRHQKSRLRLKAKPAHARMIARNLVTSLLLYESIRTTKKRAKVIAPMVDRLIGYACKEQPHRAVRMINRIVTDRNASRKIMEVYRERYAGRSSGLTRIVPVGSRLGDGAEVVDLVLVDAVVGADEGKEIEERKGLKEIKDSASAKTDGDGSSQSSISSHSSQSST